MIEKVFQNRKYRYGKLQELEMLDTKKEGHLYMYIEQVKKGAIHIYMYFDRKWGLFIHLYISGRAEKGAIWAEHLYYTIYRKQPSQVI